MVCKVATGPAPIGDDFGAGAESVTAPVVGVDLELYGS